MSEPRKIYIRASSLSAFPDCLRRTAARVFKPEVQAAGFELRELPPGVGAATGQGCHAGAAYSLQSKIDTGEAGNATEAEQRALEAFDAEIQPGVTWDDTSPNKSTAQQQIVRQVKAYRADVVPTTEPVAVEEYMEAPFTDEIIVTGHTDAREVGRIRDLKTGIIRRPNGFQYGLYSLLARHHGHQIDELVEDYLPRARLTKPQPAPEQHHYNVAQAEAGAWAIIQRMADDLKRFRETGEPWEFLANPMSMMCGDKYCPAHGTPFCRAHKDAK